MSEEETKDYNFNVWQQTFDPVFSEICKASRLPDRWLDYSRVSNGDYKDSIIKPVNRYVEKLYQPPQLVSIIGNKVRLRQQCHADFFLLQKNKNIFFNLDRPWLRQYYQTRDKYSVPDNCFCGLYKFYVPWFIDEDVFVSFEKVDDSPFNVYEQGHQYSRVDPNSRYIEPFFVPFSFMKTGSHMIDKEFGKIKRLSPMFDMVFEADDIIVQRVRKFYEQD